MPRTTLPLVICLGLLFLSSRAYAYLDPGTGSLLLQGAIAAIASVSFALRIYWQRIKAYIAGRDEVGTDAVDNPPDEPQL